MKVTPMLQQYLDCKQRYPDAVLFFRMGDFYEMLFEDAQVVSRELGLTLTARNKNSGEDEIPMAGVPHHAYQTYVAQLIEKGFTVAIAEQLEDPANAEGSIVRRDVIKVITPGMAMDVMDGESREPTYVAAVDTLGSMGAGFGVAYLDAGTGDFRATEVASVSDLLTELGRINAREILVPDYASELTDELKRGLRGAFVRERTRETYGRAGLIKLISGPRVKSHREAEGYYHDRASIEKLLGASGAFGFQAPELVESACCGVLRYVVETQRGVPSHVRRMEPYRTSSFLIVDEATKANLELTETLMGGKRQGSLLSVMDRTVTSAGARRLRHWLHYPLVDAGLIERRLDAVEELVQHPALRQDIRAGLGHVFDIERLCGRLSSGSANARDLRSLLVTLDAIPALKDVLGDCKAELLCELDEALDPCEELCALIDRAIVDDPPTTTSEGGLFKVGYDADLDEIIHLSDHGKDWMLQYEAKEKADTGISSLKIKYNKVFGYYLEVTKANFDLVPKRYLRKQTLANAERYYTPELKEMEDKILGAEDRRSTLEQELFEALRRQVAGQIDRLLRTANELANLDVIAGLSELAERQEYSRPTLFTDGRMNLMEGRHPVVETTLTGGDRFIPNSVTLGPQRRLGLITGPNMAGKSTVIRQVALITLMAQMGSFVPAKEAEISLVDKIFSRVGASDNLARGQSTFMVEMTETAHILRHATSRSLVILDEIGRGTATYDGLSIAWAVAEHLHDTIQARTLFATHYHELTELVDRLSGAFNMSIAVKEWKDDIIFLRKLIEGPASHSYGIQVGRLAGLPEAVVARAKEILARLETHSAPGEPPVSRPDDDTPRAEGVSVAQALRGRGVPAPAPAAPAAPPTPVAPPPAPTPAPTQFVAAAPVEAELEPESERPGGKHDSPQLSLFGSLDAMRPQERQILDALREIDPNSMTPLEALNVLAKLVDELRPTTNRTQPRPARSR
jgi:DNA mismatch repair protein MutS